MARTVGVARLLGLPWRQATPRRLERWLRLTSLKPPPRPRLELCQQGGPAHGRVGEEKEWLGEPAVWRAILLVVKSLYSIRFEPAGLLARVEAGTTLLEAARSVGLPVASACGADGVCGRCGMRILEGGEALPPETANEAAVKRNNRIDPELRLACHVEVECSLAATALYW